MNTDFVTSDDKLIFRLQDNPSKIFSKSEYDILKILQLPYYNRYADKTQVYSLVENDDITRRSLHVQLVSFIARTIGKLLSLNVSLIEAISLAHDIGHTPFGHVGERYLDKIMFENCGIHFYHNIQSVRVLEDIFSLNLSYQAIVGVLCHCGKFFDSESKISLSDSQFVYSGEDTYDNLHKKIQYVEKEGKGIVKSFVADTLEGIVVRISDVLAYIARDRSDTLKVGYGIEFEDILPEYKLIEEFIEDIVKNSSGKPYIALSKEKCDELNKLRDENFSKIYIHSDYNGMGDSIIFPLFKKLYFRLYDDLKNRATTSIIFKHHLGYISSYSKNSCFNIDMDSYIKDFDDINLNKIVADFISSMSDDYFVSLCKLYYPEEASKLMRQGYFDHNNYLTKP